MAASMVTMAIIYSQLEIFTESLKYPPSHSEWIIEKLVKLEHRYDATIVRRRRI
jgi:hypothetical protein